MTSDASRSKDRRKFCKTGLVFAAGVVASGGLLLKTANASSAQHILKFASPYPNDSEYAPSAQTAFKRNVEKITGGEIKVELTDSGKAGVAGKLLGRVTRNILQGGIISVSNLSRFTHVVDVLNIPFWSATNQQFINLVTSPAWHDVVNKTVTDRGLHILYPCVVGARTAATVKSYGKIIKMPEDMNGVLFRIPTSAILKQFYDLVGAQTFRIEWGDTARILRKGKIQALDPSPLGLYSGPDNVKDTISKISLINSVHDGWVSILNRNWLMALPPRLQDKVLEAAELTGHDQLKEARHATDKVRGVLETLGVEFYAPTDSEKSAWQSEVGSQRPEWDDWKIKLLGSVAAFDPLVEAANTRTRFTF